jgi:hypothetical protein
MEKLKTLATTGVMTNSRVSTVEFLLYSFVAFAVPFCLAQPQLVVGSIVNAALILAALNLKNYKILPIILLPSFAVLTRGLIFGPFTYLLVFTMPFIWIGNLMLVYSIKYFYTTKKMNRYLVIALSIALKVAFLYTTALILIRLGILPKVFAISMGVFQLYTAIIGTVIAISIQSVRSRLNKE